MAKISLIILLTVLSVYIKLCYSKSIYSSDLAKSNSKFVPVKYWTKEQKDEEALKLKKIANDNDEVSISSFLTTTNFTFYSQLNDLEKDLYDAVYEASTKSPPVLNMEFNVTSKINDYISFSRSEFLLSEVKVFSALIYENPELFWVGDFDIIDHKEYPFEKDGEKYTTYSMTYRLNNGPLFINLSPEEIDKKNKEVVEVKDEIVQKINDLKLHTTYGIVKFVHNYFVTYMEYNTESIYNITLVGGLVEQKGVCEAYSESFQYLTREFGINSIIARSLYHEWNYVEMDNGKYYVIDVTHDDPYTKDENPVPYVPGYAKNIQYNYFLTGTEHVSNSTKLKFSDEYYHVLIPNPFQYPGVTLVYPKIEKEDYIPTEEDLKESKIVDEYFNSLPVPSVTAKPHPTPTDSSNDKPSSGSDDSTGSSKDNKNSDKEPTPGVNPTSTTTTIATSTTSSTPSKEEDSPSSGFSFKNYGLITLSNILIILISFILI